MVKLATSSALLLTLGFALMAEAANCPLVDMSGIYMVQLITDNPSPVCPAKGGGRVLIQPDRLIVQSKSSGGGPSPFNFGGGWPGSFGGRVEPSSEPMQWFGTSAHESFAIELTGTLRQGQLSGQFVAQRSKGELVKCKGRVIGFKTGK